MITIAICDDTARDRCELYGIVKEYCDINGISAEILEYSSGEEYLKSECDTTDILLLDEEMPGVSGIEVKESLRQAKLDTQIIFVTSHTEILEEAYGRNVVGFITKPIDKEKLYKKLDEAIEELLEYKYKAVTAAVMLDGSNRDCIVDDIVYIKAAEHYTELYLKDEILMSCRGINEYADELKDNFFMTERSYLVNLKYAGTISDARIGMRNGSWIELDVLDKKIPLGRRRKKDFELARKRYKARGIIRR